MARNGSGTYSLPAGNPVSPGTTISSSTHNSTNTDIANALTQSLSKDGQTTPTGNLPMAGFKHTGVGDAALRNQYATAGQIQDGAFIWCGTSVGTANAITLSTSPPITAYTAGQILRFIAGNTNTTAVTININAIGVKNITKIGASPLLAGDIITGQIITIIYDGTQFQLSSSAVPSFIQSGTGAVSRSLQDKARDIISFNDYGGTPTQQLQEAIDYLSSVGGGIVYLARGSVTLDSITIPAGVSVRGQSRGGTIVTYTGSGIFALLGGTAGTNYYGCEISDMSIITTHVDATAVSAQGTVGAYIGRLKIEGTINATRTNKGVVIDGKNASSFFNHVEDVICNHIHNSYLIQSTGTSPNITYPTTQKFTNCSAFGDVATDSTSVGLEVGQYSGNGTVISGGNIENCGKGFNFKTGCGSISIIGTRLEPDNTVDVYYEPTVNPQKFYGVVNLDSAKITDNSGTGYDRHEYISCVAPNSDTFGNRFHESKFTASRSGSVAQITQGFPSSAQNLHDYENSAASILSSIRSNGILDDLSRRISADRGDNSVTLTIGTDLGKQRFATGLTADRTVSISTTNAINGDKFEVTREASATGAFVLNVAGKSLTVAGQWCVFVYNGSSWILRMAGSL